MTQRNNQDQKKRENGSSNHHHQQQQHLQSNGNFKQQDNLKQSSSVMQWTLNKLSLKRLSFTGKLGRDQTCKDEESDDGKFVGLKSRLAAALKFVNCNNTYPESGKQLRTSLDGGGGPWDDMQYSETQNYVGTLDLFRYAKLRELIAIGCGILLMVYAASWQPISVFILAIMASLMGQYTKQMKWIKQLHQNNSNTNDGQQSISTTTLSSSSLSVTEATTEASGSDGQLVQHNYDERAYYVGMINDCNSGNNNNNLTIASDQDNGGIEQTPALSLSSSSSPLLAGLNYLASNGIGINVGQLDSAPAGLAAVPTLSPYTSYSFLNPLNSIVGPLFDLSGLSGHGGGKINYVPEGQVQDEHIRTAINELLDYESEQFLHKSFEINASAFLLALTQLLAFFLGMILITWAAKKQASRVKYLYFESCLHQEVTWFEAIDSASGSGSSLNGLVDKYQDGIGMKLALLCYFSGHVGLFALTAFYQMFSLAVFCMPFVLIIGIIIAYLSDWQANSIGQHALFAKRSLQLAEEIIAAIRTVFAFNGQQKEITRYSLSLEPVYRKSLLKHLYTALNTSLSKFSIFACFAFYCFYAKHLFPPYSDKANVHNKATILAVMRGAEVSIVNILISIPFLEALQQSKGSIARIFVAIERRSKINAASSDGLKLDEPTGAHHKNDAHATPAAAASCQQHHINSNQLSGHSNDCSTKATSVGDVDKSATGINLANFVNGANGRCVPPGANCCSSERSKSCASSDGGQQDWLPSISFRAVTFDYADRSGPTRRRSLLPFLNLAAGPFLDGYTYANNACTDSTSAATHTNNAPSSAYAAHATVRRKSLTSEVLQSSGPAAAATTTAGGVANQRRRSFIEQITDEAIDATEASSRPLALANGNNHHDGLHSSSQQQQQLEPAKRGSQSNLIRHMLGNEIRERQYGSEKQILNYFNLDIKPGQSVALVGPSGSGKSTVLALVQRLYDVISGQLLIGEHDIRQLNIAWLRNQISLVGQEPRLFDMSIAENIMLGLPNDEFERLVLSQVDVNGASGNRDSQIKLDNCDDGDGDDDDSDSDDDDDKSSSGSDIKGGRRRSKSSSSAGDSSSSGGSCSSGASAEANWRQLMQQVMEAARAANAHEFIVRLPSGYATRVGSGGVQLSGGQKQRIAIARALIRRPKILLLDECTSALDSESEAQVHAALKLASANRTTIIVAHRLETIRHVDLIAVMSQGQVVASGTHDELMSAASEPGAEDHAGAKIYKQLYEEQLNSRLTATKSDDNLAALPASADGDTLTGTSGRLPATEQSSNGDGGGAAGKKQVANSDEVAGGCKGADEDDKEDVDWGDDDGDNLSGSELSNRLRNRPSVWKLWQFIETPKWPALASVIVCLLAGLILPLNLIAHSYLFSVFAYNELDQIGEYLHVFGLLILSFSTFVFIVSFLQVMLPGYVGEKMSIGLRIKTMDSLLQKPMFYFDMDSNSAGSICDRFNGYISSLQNLAGTRVATMLEAVSTLTVGAIFGFGMSFALSTFCLSFALLVLITTIIESRIVERESALQQEFDGQLAHLMADALSNIKTIASLNRENYFIHKFASILKQRERGIGPVWTSLQAFLTSLKFVMPALSWSASMYYGSYLLASGRIDLQTIYIVCPVVLFAVNDTFRALVFLPELLKARKSIERLYKLNSEFSPQVLQTLTLAQQLEEQNRLHLQQLFAHAAYGATSGAPMKPHASAGAGSEPIHLDDGTTDDCVPRARRGSRNNGRGVGGGGDSDGDDYNYDEQCREKAGGGASRIGKPKKSISFAVGPPSVSPLVDVEQNPNGRCAPHQQSSNSDSAAGANLSNRRLSNLQSLPTYMRRKASRLNSLVPRSSTRGRIEFKHVEFSYPNRPSALVLEDFSLSIEPGESVALVGTSGSGKSTTVAILEKFYDYHAGDVTLDGCDLRLVEPNWVRSQIGLVQQEPCLLSYTIGDNIRYGDNSRFVSMSEVVEAARTANIHDFIMTLPDKYDTELSSSAYSSCQLSGGQRQRIAIARALIRNAPILIFDEATSALDNKSEQVVQDALNKAKRGKTNLTIAHRLATIKDADKIVVLRDGRVVEQGRHEQLIDRPNGFYKYLWERQGGGGGSGSDGANPNGVSGF